MINNYLYHIIISDGRMYSYYFKGKKVIYTTETVRSNEAKFNPFICSLLESIMVVSVVKKKINN